MRNILFALICFTIFFTGCNKSNVDSHRVTLSSMGASSAHPFFDIIYTHYENLTGNNIKHDGHNNKAGILSLHDKTIDFITSDVCLSDEELQWFSDEILHIPICLGAVALVFNIPDVPTLNLSGHVIASVFLNNITYWDDAQIKAINPDINLPHLKIKPIGRIDGGGANYIFSDYLSQNSPEWSGNMGKGIMLHWTSIIAVDGDIMASELVRTIPGSIGYTSVEHANILDLKIASVQNSSGKFVEPTKESILTAADMDYPDDMRVMIANSDKEEAYPLSCIFWFLVYKNQAYANRKIEKYEALRDFLYFSINPQQQKIASGMNYVALPEKMLDKSRHLMESMVWKK